jgi:hypothetical protein
MNTNITPNTLPTYEEAMLATNALRSNNDSLPAYSQAGISRVDTPISSVNTRQITPAQTNIQSRSMANPFMLSSGDIVNNDTNNENFIQDLLKMSSDDILIMQRKIHNYPSEYPMPCMQITALQLRCCLDKALEIYYLTKQEKQVLREIINELDSLSPCYPYNKSLAITYKILTVLSFLECRFKFLGTDSRLHDTKKLKKLDLKKYFASSISLGHIKILNGTVNNYFKPSCSLVDIHNLPWQKLQENTHEFEQALQTIYDIRCFLDNNTSINNLAGHQDTPINLLTPLRSKNILIPYTGELNISQRNKLWGLPINLADCSTEVFFNNKLIPHYSMSTSLQDKDFLMPNNKFERFLLAVCRKNKSFIPPGEIFEFVARIYQNKDTIDEKFDNFKALEIALYIWLNEKIGNKTDTINAINPVRQTLKNIFISTYDISSVIFPNQYKDLQEKDIRNAAWFLLQLKEHLKDKSFNSSLDLIKNDINDGKRDLAIHETTSDSRLINTDTYSPVEKRQEIYVAVRENQKKLIEIGVNPSIIVNILFTLDYDFGKTIEEAVPDVLPLILPNGGIEHRWLKHYITCSRVCGDNPEKTIKAALKNFK